MLLGICLLLGCSAAGSNDTFERGLEAIKKQDYDLAITSFSAFLREHPKSVDAYINRGFAHYRKKEYDRAIKDCTEAIKLDPRAADAYFNRGAAYCGKEQYDKAIPDLTQAIKLDPQADIYATRGDAYRQQNDFEKAMADFKEALRLDPNNITAYYNRAVAYGLKKEQDKAIADYTRVLQLDARLVPAYRNRGDAYRRKKDFEKALKDYEEAVRLAPEDGTVCEAMAWLLATCPKKNLRDGKKAVDYATKACRYSSWKNAYYLDTLAAAHAECGNFKDAIKWQKRAMEQGWADKEMAARARQRLKLYEEGKPFRDE